MIEAFDIICASWNNLPCLKLLYKSIRKNSATRHNFFVHVQEQCPDTVSWLEEQKISHTFSEANIGMCSALNALGGLGEARFVCIMDDDQYVGPNWDIEFLNFLEKSKANPEAFLLCGTNVEPRPGSHPTIFKNYGVSPGDFREEDFIRDVSSASLKGADLRNHSSTPILLPRILWDSMGGYDEDFNPAMGADDSIAKVAWDKNCRTFIQVGKTLVYHFSRSTTSRWDTHPENLSLRKEKIFKDKYKLSSSDFIEKYIQRGKLLNETPLL